MHADMTCGMCHRRQQAALQCDLQFFHRDVELVDTACCDDGLSCPGGVPTTCDAKCAITYVPFWEQCSPVLATQVDASSLASYQRLFTTCDSMLPVEPLLRLAAECGVDEEECASSPCQNGGACVDEDGSYSCLCAAGFDPTNNCERFPPPPPPGRLEVDVIDSTCGTMHNLAALTSPYTGSISGSTDDVSTCGRGGDEVFFIDLLPDMRIDIGQDSNTFDSKHSTRWGGACPGDNSVRCTDDPDTTRHHWTNNQGQTERVYFILDSYSSSAHGDFVLSWTVGAPVAPLPGQTCAESLGNCPVGTQVQLTADACDYADACNGGASIHGTETGEITAFSTSSGHPQVRGPSGATWYFHWEALRTGGSAASSGACSDFSSSHNYADYHGYRYRRLCESNGSCGGGNQDDYLPLPPGWELVPLDTDGIHVVDDSANQDWIFDNTDRAIFADGTDRSATGQNYECTPHRDADRNIFKCLQVSNPSVPHPSSPEVAGNLYKSPYRSRQILIRCAGL